MRTEEQRDAKRLYDRARYQVNRAKVKVQCAAWRAAHPEQDRAQRAAWRSANVEKRKAYDRARYQANRSAANAQSRAWYAANREKDLARKRAHHVANRGAHLARQAAWRKGHPENSRAWAAAHPEKRKVLNNTAGNRVRARKAGASGSHTSGEWIVLKLASGWRCAYCRCRLDEKTAHRDHRVPLSRGGSDSIENIAVCCKSCNSRKRNQTDVEFTERVAASA